MELSVQSLSHVQLFATPWTAARQASRSITNSRSLLKLMSIESVMPSNHSSSVIPFSSCLQSSPASGSFPMSQLFVTPWTAARQASLSITNSQNLLKLMSIESVMPSNHSSSVVPFCSRLQSFPASGSFPRSQLFDQVAKVLELQLQHSPSNEYLGLISFRMEWLDLLAVQGTHKSLLQHHSSKASILRCSSPTLTSIHDHWKNHSLD